MTQIFYLSEMDGGKILKIQDFGQFMPFWIPLGPLLGPLGAPHPSF